MRPALTLTLVLAFALVLGACTTFIAQPGPDPEPGGRYVTLTTPIIAIGDTQEHLATGYPLHDNDSAVDACVEVAQRPPEQPLFGRRLMEWVLQNHPEQPYLHLGDVRDLSCRAEAERVAGILAATRNPVAILPGNHDGLLFGIYGYNVVDAALDPDARRWVRGCRRGAKADHPNPDAAREALSKRDLISGYIALQAASQPAKPGLAVPPPTGDRQVSWRSPDREAYLSALEAKVFDGGAYAASYLAQRLKLPRAEMRKLEQPLVYLSAHTHGGFWAAHRARDRRPVLELNVSSLSDWPLAYRRISFAYDEAARRLLVRGELMPKADLPVATYADLLAAWERETCARSGLPVERIHALDLAVVRQQRAARCSLIEWLMSAIPACET